jgi:predicted DNA-binding mobile mystery protein A
MGNLAKLRNVVSGKQGWISSVRQALGMTARQLAGRLGLSQPRVAKMEINEDNLKISTMKKIAEGLDCDFVYGFVPKTSLQDTIDRQARKKASDVLSKVNANMALEDQLAQDPHIMVDLANEMIAKNIKQIWDE